VERVREVKRAEYVRVEHRKEYEKTSFFGVRHHLPRALVRMDRETRMVGVETLAGGDNGESAERRHRPDMVREG